MINLNNISMTKARITRNEYKVKKSAFKDNFIISLAETVES